MNEIHHKNVENQLNAFLSNSNYTNPVDLKKLVFIYRSIVRYAQKKNIPLAQLEILEVGCGSGGITFPLGYLGCRVKTFDINPDTVKTFRKENDRLGLHNITVVVGDGISYDDDKQYDIVIVSEVLEHTVNPSKFLFNIALRMKKEAYLILTVPNGFGPWELVNQLFRKLYQLKSFRKLLYKGPTVEIVGETHIQFFSKSMLLKLLSEFSFDFINFSNSDAFFAACWHFVKPNKRLAKFDSIISNYLPYWCASGWYFLLFKE